MIYLLDGAVSGCLRKRLSQETVKQADRRIVFTSSYDDWMWRGDDPIVKEMSWYVYSIWVYKVELQKPLLDAPMHPRHIDIEYTHIQRLAAA